MVDARSDKTVPRRVVSDDNSSIKLPADSVMRERIISASRLNSSRIRSAWVVITPVTSDNPSEKTERDWASLSSMMTARRVALSSNVRSMASDWRASDKRMFSPDERILAAKVEDPSAIRSPAFSAETSMA